MATITGMAGAVSLGGSAVNGKITGWKLNTESQNIETTGAGDTVVERVHKVLDWTIEADWFAQDAPSWDQHHGLVGTSAAVAIKRKAADANAYATGTGLVVSCETDETAEQAVKGHVVIKCNGTALTFDTTPAT